MTVADVAFLNTGVMASNMSAAYDIWEKFPKLKALKEKVESHPIIAEWIRVRPDAIV